MTRFLFKLIICALLATAAGATYLAFRSRDALYTVYEWMSPARFQQYDVLIRAIAGEHQLVAPKKNLEAGSCYLQHAFQHWQHQPNPIPFALAEYNAGPSRAQRWAGGDDSIVMSSETFRRNIDFPKTRKYVSSIMERYEFYKRRGRM